MKWIIWMGIAIGFGWTPVTGLAEARVAVDAGPVYRTFEAEPGAVRLLWLDPDGKRFGLLQAARKFLEDAGEPVRMVTNGGIFKAGGVPNGLCVVDGKTVQPLNQNSGQGNFFLKPNGVFYVDASGAHVCSTEQYAERSPAARIAIQSGPLMLEDGLVHPAFIPDSTSRLHRNGVGILPDGRVLFAITDFDRRPFPNLYEFATFFRERGCRDALFLDGDLSQMEVGDGEMEFQSNYFGSIIAVVGTEAEESKRQDASK